MERRGNDQRSRSFGKRGLVGSNMEEGAPDGHPGTGGTEAPAALGPPTASASSAKEEARSFTSSAAGVGGGAQGRRRKVRNGPHRGWRSRRTRAWLAGQHQAPSSLRQTPDDRTWAGGRVRLLHDRSVALGQVGSGCPQSFLHVRTDIAANAPDVLPRPGSAKSRVKDYAWRS